MNDREKSPKNADPEPLSDLKRELEKARKKEAAAEREAEKTLERAEQLEEKSRELGEEGERIRKKAAEPIGFPPPPKKGKSKQDS
jgi:predicted  nucleic acid-binding Zn-ribbon protein